MIARGIVPRCDAGTHVSRPDWSSGGGYPDIPLPVRHDCQQVSGAARSRH